MSKRIGRIVILCEEPEDICEMCGKKEELRPYGPRGERICFECGQKNPEATTRQLNRILFGEEIQ